MAQSITKAGGRLRKTNLPGSSFLTTCSAHVRLKHLLPINIRTYNSTTQLRDYPKEGVFQPNSPSRQPINQLPQQNQSNTYFPNEQQNAQPLQQSPPSSPPRQFRPWSWAFGTLLCLASGVFGFTYMTTVGLAHAPMPFEPGSPEDHEELQLLAEEYDALPLVQELREEYRFDLETNSRIPAWNEWVAYRGLSDPTSTSASVERRANMLSTGPLRGSRGLAAQSVFWNEQEKIAMVFINFGEAVCGWPGVVHGGAIATVMDEALARVAMRCTAGRDIVTANLKIDYRDKVQPGQWYVLVAQLTDAAEGQAENTESQQQAAVERHPTTFTSAPVSSTPQAPLPQESASKSEQVESIKKSTDRKKYIEGALICVSEYGPTKADIFNPHPDDTNSSPTHVHALGHALYVVPKNFEVGSAPEEF